MTKKRCSLKEEQPICHRSDRIRYAAALTSFSMLKDVLSFIWVRYGIDAEREQVDISPVICCLIRLCFNSIVHPCLESVTNGYETRFLPEY